MNLESPSLLHVAMYSVESVPLSLLAQLAQLTRSGFGNLKMIKIYYQAENEYPIKELPLNSAILSMVGVQRESAQEIILLLKKYGNG